MMILKPFMRPADRFGHAQQKERSAEPSSSWGCRRREEQVALLDGRLQVRREERRSSRTLRGIISRGRARRSGSAAPTARRSSGVDVDAAATCCVLGKAGEHKADVSGPGSPDFKCRSAPLADRSILAGDDDSNAFTKSGTNATDPPARRHRAPRAWSERPGALE